MRKIHMYYSAQARMTSWLSKTWEEIYRLKNFFPDPYLCVPCCSFLSSLYSSSELLVGLADQRVQRSQMYVYDRGRQNSAWSAECIQLRGLFQETKV